MAPAAQKDADWAGGAIPVFALADRIQQSWRTAAGCGQSCDQQAFKVYNAHALLCNIYYNNHHEPLHLLSSQMTEKWGSIRLFSFLPLSMYFFKKELPIGGGDTIVVEEWIFCEVVRQWNRQISSL